MSAVTPSGRAALVQSGSRWGAGFSISPRLLLTASYVVEQGKDEEGENPRVRTPGSETFTDAEVLWTSDRLKVALIRRKGTPTGTEEDYCSLGRLAGRGPRQCEATGFDDRFADEGPTAVRITGTVDPGAWPESRFFRFDAARPIADHMMGMGGAGLCVDDSLVGILIAVHRQEGWFRVTPFAEIMNDEQIRRLLHRELGSTPKIVDLLPSETTVSGALKGVSEADPANIQEVAAAQFGLSNLYYENVLAQAKRSFNAAVVAAVVGLAFFLAAVTFAMVTKQLAASIMSLVGAAWWK